MESLRTTSVVIKDKHIIKKINDMLIDTTCVYDQTLYYYRQEYFRVRDINNDKKSKLKEGEKMVYEKAVYPKLKEVYDLVKEKESWKESKLDHVVKTAALQSAITNWFTMLKSLKVYFKGGKQFDYNYNVPGFPHYLLKHNRVINLTIDKTRLRKKGCKNNQLKLPKSDIKLNIPKNINRKDIRCLIITRYYDYIKINFVYNKIIKQNNTNLDSNNVIGIDMGTNNILAITTNNQDKSWIVKGGRIKSINQYCNKKVADIKSELEKHKKFTSKRLRKLYMKRGHKIDYECHCISKKIILLCLMYNIGKIVIGHNNNWKQNVHLGKSNTETEKRNNQNFVSIPHSKLINYIKYKAEEQGIKVIVVEESYTSKIDHLALESLEHQESYLGKRLTRGLYKSSICGKLLNADCNGAIGIMRKANEISDADIICLRNRGDVVSPLILKY